MVHALGYSANRFDPSNPGRLCRGRERWVEGYPIEPGQVLHRFVVSGARFTDDTARDASRGLEFSGVTVSEVLASLFPGQPLLAFREQGELDAVPGNLVSQEVHLQPRLAGRRMDPCVRWRALAQDPLSLDRFVSEAPGSADGFIPVPSENGEAVEEALFLLTGYAERMAFPQRRFQPSALVDLLALVPFVVCIHLDKHGVALGVYSRQEMDPTALEGVATARGALVVPFSIPPMLARWDRAIFELRLAWEGRGGQEFPVPPGERGGARDVVASYEREE